MTRLPSRYSWGNHCFLSQFFSDVHWELYNTDCINVRMIQDNPLANQVTGFFSFFAHFCLVVEFDLPWDDSDVRDYGDSFKAWGSDEFALAVANTKIALPYANLVFVVFFMPF